MRTKFHQLEIIDRDLITKGISKEIRLKSIQLHFSIKNQEDPKKILFPIIGILETISGQKVKLNTSKKTLNSNQKRQEKGSLSGLSTKIREKKIYEFLEYFTSIVIPIIISQPGAEKISIKSFDIQGNLVINLENVINFPEIAKEFKNFQLGSKSEHQFLIGIDISFVTSAENSSQALLLLSAFQIPIEKTA